MNTINRYNFFKHTFCDFIKVEQDFFEENQIHFESKAGSKYSYTEEGVYRYSNHWGRVANCRWRLVSEEKLKSQNYYLGFAKWEYFYALNDSEKLFYINVDFEAKKAMFLHQKNKGNVHLFYAQEAQKRIEQINKLLKEEKWANYFEMDIELLRKKIISQYSNSDKTLQEIKLEYS